jgi:hypothetical protein
MSKGKFEHDKVCRVCGSEYYLEKLDYSGITDGGGVMPRVKDYVCCGCTTKFEDPKRFSAKPEERKSAG